MKLALEQKEKTNGCLPWSSSLPFVENKRAILIHRPREVTTYTGLSHHRSHLAVHLWCGAAHVGGHQKFAFHNDPPAEKLLCAVCEARAVMAGQLPSDELAGRHVHIGRLKPYQTCCGEGND